jgi:hypothetical protein
MGANSNILSFSMSIYGAVVALNLALNSSVAINPHPSIYHHQVNQSDRIAQTVPLSQINDGIRDGRAQLDRLIKTIRNQPKLTPLKRATGISNLYFRRAKELDLAIEGRGSANFASVSPENKNIIIQRWKAESDSLKKLAEQEIEPHLTPMQREFINTLKDPVKMKKLGEEASRQAEIERQRAEDARKIRDALGGY